MSIFEFIFNLLFYTVITFGNGSVMFPLLEDALVSQYQIISQEQMLYSFAIARVTPGQANLYISAIGLLSFGITGALAAAFTIILPSFLMIPLLKGYEKVKNIDWVNKFVKGVTVTSVGLIFSATTEIGQDVLISPIAWIVFISVLVFSRVFKLNGFVNLIIASIFGILLELIF